MVSPPQPRLPMHVDLERPLPDLVHQAASQIEREYIRKALKKSRGNVGRCAQMCGMDRVILERKMAEYGGSVAAGKNSHSASQAISSHLR
jgi:DNA-binding NtrC family response regulator